MLWGRPLWVHERTTVIIAVEDLGLGTCVLVQQECLHAGKYVHRFVKSLDIYIHVRLSVHSPVELSPTPSPIYNPHTKAILSQSKGTRDFAYLRQQHLNTSLCHMNSFLRNQTHPETARYPSPNPPSPLDPFSPYS